MAISAGCRRMRLGGGCGCRAGGSTQGAAAAPAPLCTCCHGTSAPCPHHPYISVAPCPHDPTNPRIPPPSASAPDVPTCSSEIARRRRPRLARAVRSAVRRRRGRSPPSTSDGSSEGMSGGQALCTTTGAPSGGISSPGWGLLTICTSAGHMQHSTAGRNASGGGGGGRHVVVVLVTVPSCIGSKTGGSECRRQSGAPTPHTTPTACPGGPPARAATACPGGPPARAATHPAPATPGQTAGSGPRAPPGSAAGGRSPPARPPAARPRRGAARRTGRARARCCPPRTRRNPGTG
jgi:hypothetical protein